MSGVIPDLEEALRKLDEELEEGDITRKGYEKRRTLILSQFINPQPPLQHSQEQAGVRSGGLRVHSPDDSDHPASNDASRAASLAALTGQPEARETKNGTISEGLLPTSRQATMLSDEYSHPRRSITPQGHAQRLARKGKGRHTTGINVGRVL